MNDLEVHPLATLFPKLAHEDLLNLVADIADCGLRQPLVLYEGKVLDGQNRLDALRFLKWDDAKIREHTVEFDGDDPLDFVVSMNLQRRHLTVGQLAVVGLNMLESLPGDFDGDRLQWVASRLGIARATLARVKSLSDAARKGDVEARQALHRIMGGGAVRPELERRAKKSLRQRFTADEKKREQSRRNDLQFVIDVLWYNVAGRPTGPAMREADAWGFDLIAEAAEKGKVEPLTVEERNLIDEAMNLLHLLRDTAVPNGEENVRQLRTAGKRR